jgi:carnitine monooxygenase subunit
MADSDFARYSAANFGLPSWTYTDPAYYAAEMERIIAPSWQIVCHVSDIPNAGDYQTLDLLGESILVVRGDDGAVRAFANVCRHRGMQLVEGKGCARKLVCPYHAWAYELDGRLSGVPMKGDYPALAMADNGLKPVDLDLWQGFIFVRLSPAQVPLGEGDHPQGGGGVALSETIPLYHAAHGPPPHQRWGGYTLSVAQMMAPAMAEIAPYRLAEMQPIGTPWARPRAVNWKNVGDNYSDNLHIPVAHDGLTRLFAKSYTISAHGWADRMAGDLADAPTANFWERFYQAHLPRAPHLPDALQRKWLYWKLWPNMAFDFYADQMDFMHWVPTGPETCMLRVMSYALPDAYTPENIRREMRLVRYANERINRVVNAEDTWLIERVQAGMRSRFFDAGPLATSEVCLRSFNAKVRDIMGDWLGDEKLPSRLREGPGVDKTTSRGMPAHPPLTPPASGRGI